MAFKYLSLWVALAFTVMIVNPLPTQYNIQKRGSMRLCGKMLVETLGVICQYNHYGGETTKRNYVYSGDNIPNWDSSFPESDGFVSPKTAQDFFGISNEPRNTRGAADECCKKRCTMHELIMSHCSTNSPDFQGRK